MSIIKQLSEELYSNILPYTNIEMMLDEGYPHTFLNSDVLKAVDKIAPDGFYLELGSMIGGSANLAANYFKTNKINREIICIDNFCGCQWMWLIEKDLMRNKEWQFLNLKDGKPTIYQRFLSNVLNSENQDVILPIQISSLSGLKLLDYLYNDKRIDILPAIIYLDSAHTEDETFIELKLSYKLLKDNGIIYGDDWWLDAVKNDVIKFSNFITPNKQKIIEFIMQNPEAELYDNKIIIYNNQWIVFK